MIRIGTTPSYFAGLAEGESKAEALANLIDRILDNAGWEPKESVDRESAVYDHPVESMETDLESGEVGVDGCGQDESGKGKGSEGRSSEGRSSEE
jgi:hypothetical protein